MSEFSPKYHEFWRPLAPKEKLISEIKSRRTEIFEKSVLYAPKVIRKNCLILWGCLCHAGELQYYFLDNFF